MNDPTTTIGPPPALPGQPKTRMQPHAWIGVGLVVGALLVGCCTGFGIGTIGEPEPKVISSPSPYAVTTIVTVAPSPAEPATAASPSAKPGPKTSFGDGTWQVNIEIKPGRYRATVPDDSINCYWERMKDFSGGIRSIIDNNNADPGTATIVQISKSDKGFHTEGCGIWTKIG